MRHYLHVLRAMMTQPWAMEPTALATLVSVMKHRLSRELGGGRQTWDDDDAPRRDPDWRDAQNHGGVAWFAQALPSAAIPHQRASAIAKKAGRVAVLPVRGVMGYRMGTLEEFSGGTSTERTIKSLHALNDDADVKAIILDLDTPGGTTDGIIEAADAVYNSRTWDKPVVAQVNPMAASAGYWLGSQAAELVVTPSGDVGSIGVLAIHEDITAWLEKTGIKETIIRSSEFKAELNPYEALTQEARAYMQERVNEFDEHFHSAVARGRDKSVGQVRESFGKGRMVGAKAAVSRGMADRVASLEETLNRFGATAGGKSARVAAQEARRVITSAQHTLRRARLKSV